MLNLLVGLLLTVVMGAALHAAAWSAARWPLATRALLMAPIVLGVVFARGALDSPHGYAAAYAFAGVWVTTIWIAVVGLAMCLPRAWRRAGKLGLLAAVVALSSFYAIYAAGYGLGLYAWKQASQGEIPATPAR